MYFTRERKKTIGFCFSTFQCFYMYISARFSFIFSNDGYQMEKRATSIGCCGESHAVIMSKIFKTNVYAYFLYLNLIETNPTRIHPCDSLHLISIRASLWHTHFIDLVNSIFYNSSDRGDCRLQFRINETKGKTHTIRLFVKNIGSHMKRANALLTWLLS